MALNITFCFFWAPARSGGCADQQPGTVLRTVSRAWWWTGQACQTYRRNSSRLSSPTWLTPYPSGGCLRYVTKGFHIPTTFMELSDKIFLLFLRCVPAGALQCSGSGGCGFSPGREGRRPGCPVLELCSAMGSNRGCTVMGPLGRTYRRKGSGWW